MNHARIRANSSFNMTTSRIFRLLALSAVLLAGAARMAGLGAATTVVYFSASATFHGNGRGAPALWVNDQSLSQSPGDGFPLVDRKVLTGR